MNASRTKRGFTLTELLIVIAVIAILIALLLPAVQAAREAARRVKCMNNQKQISLGLMSYESAYNKFPPSAELVAKAGNEKKSVGGWSFLVKILPYLDQNAVYNILPPKGDPEDANDKNTVLAMNTMINTYVCPSAADRSFQNMKGAAPTMAVTNYKGVGATTRDSLKMVLDPNGKPPYGTAKIHADGAMFPGEGTRLADFTDGLSHTVQLMETIDNTASRWTVGREATLVALPQKSSPVGDDLKGGYPYFSPPGFDGTFGPNSAVSRAGLRTFLMYDFGPQGADAGKYEDPGFSKVAAAYGPSSAHPAIVISSFADGAVYALSKQTDPAALFFYVTKAGGDPFEAPN